MRFAKRTCPRFELRSMPRCDCISQIQLICWFFVSYFLRLQLTSRSRTQPPLTLDQLFCCLQICLLHNLIHFFETETELQSELSAAAVIDANNFWRSVLVREIERASKSHQVQHFLLTVNRPNQTTVDASDGFWIWEIDDHRAHVVVRNFSTCGKSSVFMVK